jgi:hypothetical protein
MGMRDSDARWIERDVIPLLESLAAIVQPVVMFEPAVGSMVPQSVTYSSTNLANAQAQRAALVTRLAETTAQAKRRLGGRQAPATAEVYRMSRNPSVEHYSADVDGQKVPYIDITRWPCVWTDSGRPEQVYPEVVLQTSTRYKDLVSQDVPGLRYAYETIVHWDGDWCWTVTVDERFAYDFDSQEDVELVLPILAQGMAVAGGFTSHGPHSFPINRHGPAVGLAPFTDFPTAELVQSEGWGPDAIADAVVARLTGAGYDAIVAKLTEMGR